MTLKFRSAAEREEIMAQDRRRLIALIANEQTTMGPHWKLKAAPD